ncbi:MAG: hypothetical protein ABIP95_07935 [Pelobium sp.]
MNIPSSSELLINGLSPVSLALAVILSKHGIKVLLIDDHSVIEPQFDQIIVDTYSIEFLKNHGFNFSKEEVSNTYLKSTEFINQALKLLATNLCSVIWDTKITDSKAANTQFILSHQAQLTIHSTTYFYLSSDLKFGIIKLDFRNIFLLAWRLIGILKGTLKKPILESYPTEYILLRTQFLANDESTKKNVFQRLIHKYVNTHSAPNLIESKTSLHLSQHRSLQAGELLPDLPFYDEKAKVNSSLHQWCSYQHFSVIIFGYLIPANLFAIAKWMQLNYPVQLYYLPNSERNESLFKELKLSIGQKKTLIVRPDKYIGLLHDGIEIDLMDNYLRNFIFMNEKTTDDRLLSE